MCLVVSVVVVVVLLPGVSVLVVGCMELLVVLLVLLVLVLVRMFVVLVVLVGMFVVLVLVLVTMMMSVVGVLGLQQLLLEVCFVLYRWQVFFGGILRGRRGGVVEVVVVWVRGMLWLGEVVVALGGVVGVMGAILMECQ